MRLHFVDKVRAITLCGLAYDPLTATDQKDRWDRAVEAGEACKNCERNRKRLAAVTG